MPIYAQNVFSSFTLLSGDNEQTIVHCTGPSKAYDPSQVEFCKAAVNCIGFLVCLFLMGKPCSFLFSFGPWVWQITVYFRVSMVFYRSDLVFIKQDGEIKANFSA